MFLETRVTKVGTHLLIVTPMQLYCKPAAAALDYGHNNHYNHGLVFVLMQSPLLCSDHLVPVSTTLTTLTQSVAGEDAASQRRVRAGGVRGAQGRCGDGAECEEGDVDHCLPGLPQDEVQSREN